MKIVVMGAPGSGKDTEAKLISKYLKLKIDSIGDYLRKEYNKKSVLGIKTYKYWSSGELCPDNLIISIAKKNLSEKNYLLSGFPRTLKQAKFLSQYSKPQIVFYLHVPNKTLIQRLKKRAKIENRIDDSLIIIKERLKIYKEFTFPVINFYKKKGLLVNINANRGINIIFKDIKVYLDKFKK